RCGILRHADRRHGLPHFHRGGPHEHRHGLGGDRCCRGRRLGLLWRDRAHRACSDVLASVYPWWIGELQRASQMKKLIVSMLAGGFSLAAVHAWAADAVTLQLKWVPQAQFASYFVAKDKGFYD